MTYLKRFCKKNIYILFKPYTDQIKKKADQLCLKFNVDIKVPMARLPNLFPVYK